MFAENIDCARLIAEQELAKFSGLVEVTVLFRNSFGEIWRATFNRTAGLVAVMR